MGRLDRGAQRLSRHKKSVRCLFWQPEVRTSLSAFQESRRERKQLPPTQLSDHAINIPGFVLVAQAPATILNKL